jgi:hypothetical protein
MSMVQQLLALASGLPYHLSSFVFFPLSSNSWPCLSLSFIRLSSLASHPLSICHPLLTHFRHMSFISRPLSPITLVSHTLSLVSFPLSFVSPPFSFDLSRVSRPCMASLVSGSFFLSLVLRSLPHNPLLSSRVSCPFCLVPCT